MSYTEQNKAWCLNQKWKAARWETLKYTFGEGALVRYVDEPALADMEGLVEFLLDAESCANLKVNEKRVHGTYVPAAAWWETVTVRGAERVRLYHECVPADAAGSGTAYVTENGCTYTVTMTPYFRQAAVAAPTAGTSGVSYRIVGERADPRTGLWMFTLEKREQKTTTTGVVTVRDDAFATVTEQTFYGVRTGNTDHTGAAVSGLWTAGVSPAGTLVENVQVRKNENCTTDVTQRKTAAKAREATVERVQTKFEKGVTITLRNQSAAVNAFVAVAGGVITRQSSKDNGDGTFDNTQTVTTAVAVGNAVIERYQTKFEAGVTITNRNQAAAVNAFVDVAGGVITRRSSKENDDGTFDNTETVTTAVAGSNATVERYRTLYEEGVTVTNRNQSAAVDAFVDVAGGIITRRSSKLNDDGTYDNTQSLTTALAVTDAMVESTGDLYGIRTRKAQRNQAAADSTTPGLTNAGTANAKITAVTNVKTEAGLYDHEKAEDTPSAAGSVELTFTGDNKTVTLIVFWNQTQTSLQALATALGKVANVSVSAHPNKWALLDGSLTATVAGAGGSESWGAWETPVDELERLPSGELLRLQGTAVFGYNVSDGASTFYGAQAYRQYSWFRDVGRNWFTYKLITSVTPVVSGS